MNMSSHLSKDPASYREEFTSSSMVLDLTNNEMRLHVIYPDDDSVLDEGAEQDPLIAVTSKLGASTMMSL